MALIQQDDQTPWWPLDWHVRPSNKDQVAKINGTNGLHVAVGIVELICVVPQKTKFDLARRVTDSLNE